MQFLKFRKIHFYKGTKTEEIYKQKRVCKSFKNDVTSLELNFFRLTLSPIRELRDPDFCASRGSTCFCKPFDKIRKSLDRSNPELRISYSELSTTSLATTASSKPWRKKVLLTMSISFQMISNQNNFSYQIIVH
jgi:hypothetical protein